MYNSRIEHDCKCYKWNCELFILTLSVSVHVNNQNWTHIHWKRQWIGNGQFVTVLFTNNKWLKPDIRARHHRTNESVLYANS